MAEGVAGFAGVLKLNLKPSSVFGRRFLVGEMGLGLLRSPAGINPLATIQRQASLLCFLDRERAPVELLRNEIFWRCVMAEKYKSEAFESIHNSAEALLKIGAIDTATMREFDEACIAEVPAEISDQENSSELTTAPQNSR
ncbi:hypothetical protein [Pseudomonas brassicacearum]|uniref:hypothetical protein n=1 Tax=Pseudomonas brassicacearum TaxID=930166 RepID=UPI001F47BADE